MSDKVVPVSIGWIFGRKGRMMSSDSRPRASYDFSPINLVEVGDRWVPAEILATLSGGTNEPDLILKIEVRQGIPVFTNVVLRARPDGPEVRMKDLANVHLDDWMESIVSACSLLAVGPDTWVGSTDKTGDRQNVRRVRSGRPRISRDRLNRVAEIYREHIDDRPTDAVRRAFGVSERTAARYVQEARKAAILPPTTPGKKQA